MSESEPEGRLRPYEAMFLVFNKEARKSHDYLEEHVKALLQKVGATAARFGCWDQRQLAYEIKGQREGVYYLVYLEAAPEAIANLRREAELSELVLRLLVIRLERIPTEEELRRRSSTAEEAMREGEEMRGEGSAYEGRRGRAGGGGRYEGAPAGGPEAGRTEGGAA